MLTQGGSLLRKTTARGGGGCRVELTGKRRRANLCKLRAVAGQAAASAGMTHTATPRANSGDSMQDKRKMLACAGDIQWGSHSSTEPTSNLAR